jgi:hypothetical protein
MRRVAVSIAVVACWVLCSLLLAGVALAQSPSEGDLYDCDDFKYQEDAQKVFDRHPGDPYGLDGPIGPASEGKPGVACEDLPHRPTSADDQYSPETSVDNPNSVVPDTNSGKPLPNTGGPPYLAVGAGLLLGAAVVAGRGVLRR